MRIKRQYAQIMLFVSIIVVVSLCVLILSDFERGSSTLSCRSTARSLNRTIEVSGELLDDLKQGARKTSSGVYESVRNGWIIVFVDTREGAE